MPTLTLYDLEPSPNNIKVRLALNWKGVPFERVAIQGADRSGLIEATGQEFTPAIRYGDVTLFDSHAILRFIDCNWRDTGGRLYPLDRSGVREIEAWEQHSLALQACIGATFGQFFAPTADEETCRVAGQGLSEATGKIEAALEGREFLGGDAPNAADFVLAPFVWYGCMTDEQAARDDLRAFFKRHLVLDDRSARAAAWAHRTMAFDR